MGWAGLPGALFGLALTVLWESGPLADPLTLERALASAEGHPRISASPAVADDLPRPANLYLDCRRVAFPGTEPDPSDNRPFVPLISPLDGQRLEIVARFLDALLADRRFAALSESMAVAYVRADRAKARHELGQANPVRTLELETLYQENLRLRTAAGMSQRWARGLLAQAMGQPEELPRDLEEPRLPILPDPLPGTADWVRRASQGNASLRERLSVGGDTDRRLVELALRERVEGLLLRIEALAAAGRELGAESTYRDLKLDQSRALYDQEVAADLGDSMSRQSQTRTESSRVDYCRALAWAELQAIAGLPIWPAHEQTQ